MYERLAVADNGDRLVDERECAVVDPPRRALAK